MDYVVKTVSGDGAVRSLSISASNEADACAHAARQGDSVLSVEARIAWPALRTRQKFSVLLFSQQLLALLDAGLSLIEALHALKNRDVKYHGPSVVGNLIGSISEGQPFSVAIARYPEYFPQLYIASIEASERTGNLREALRRFIVYQEQMDRVRKTLVSAATYPALVLGVGTLVVGFLLFYVVPRFSAVYESYSGELGLFSSALIATGNAVAKHGELVFGSVLIAIAAIVALVLSSDVRSKCASALQVIPVLSENTRLYELSRLYRTLGMLLEGGIPILRAVGMVSNVLSQARRADLSRAGRLISEGHATSTAFDETKLATPVAARMMVVGERTGDMGSMMQRAAEFHEDELARWLERFSKLFEPILMLAIGLVVGAIVVIMYMPIFELATTIQ